MPTGATLATAAVEIAVHGWDVGRTTGAGEPMPDDSPRACCPPPLALVDALDRHGAFGPPLPCRPTPAPGGGCSRSWAGRPDAAVHVRLTRPRSRFADTFRSAGTPAGRRCLVPHVACLRRRAPRHRRQRRRPAGRGATLVLRGDVREALARLRRAAAPCWPRDARRARRRRRPRRRPATLARGAARRAPRRPRVELDRLARRRCRPPSAAGRRTRRGELGVARSGRSEAAVEHYLAAGRTPARTADPVVDWRSGAALAMLRTGRRREAHELALEQHRLALTHGTAARRRRGAARARGHRRPDASRVGAAARGARPARPLRGRAAGRPGGHRPRRAAGAHRRRDRARTLPPHLLRAGRGARRSARACGRSRAGLRGLLDRLGRAGRGACSPRRSPRSPPPSGGSRRLALGGLTNREIAEELGHHRSRPSSGHLSRVYRKLGIRCAALATPRPPHDRRAPTRA